MSLRQQIFALAASVALLIFIVEMVRRRRLREEYSWLWIIVAVILLVLTVWFGLLEWLTHLIGAVVPVSTFFVFGILFLVVINVYFSIKISTLTTQVKNLAQRLAILDHYVEVMRNAGGKRAESGDDSAQALQSSGGTTGAQDVQDLPRDLPADQKAVGEREVSS